MIARRPLPAWAEIAVLPLVNIALAFLTVGIIVRIIGVDPFYALKLLIVGEVPVGQANERMLGLMMAGAKAPVLSGAEGA